MKTSIALDSNGIPVICQKHIHEKITRTERGILFCPSCNRNKRAREKNQILRELCGTSARAAKLDMGL